MSSGHKEKTSFPAVDLPLWQEAATAYNIALHASGIAGKEISFKGVAPYDEADAPAELWPMVSCRDGFDQLDELDIIQSLRVHVMQSKSEHN